VIGSRVVNDGVRSGESIHREVAASIVDEYVGFGVVPKTRYASFFSPVFVGARKALLRQSQEGEVKMGSFQKFVEGTHSLVHIKKEVYRQIPLSTLQPIFALDLLIGHLDRHFSNLLFDGNRVYAIDNGLSFPDGCEELARLGWCKLPQAGQLFTSDWIEKIGCIDWERLKEKLKKKTQLPLECFPMLHTRLALLQAAVKASLPPVDIVKLMNRENFTRLRDLELSIQIAAEQIVIRFLSEKR
jgi:hypothetical protein